MSGRNDNNAEVLRSGIFEWNPAELIKARPQTGDKTASEQGSDKFALVVLNQPLQHLDVTRRLWDNAQVRIAADGGANALYKAAGEHGDSSFDDLAVIIGDLDSLTPSVQSYYESRKTKTQVIRDPDQESTDFGKAVAYIRQHYHNTATTTTTTATTTTTPSNPSNPNPQPHHHHHQQPDHDHDHNDDDKPLDIVAIGGLGGRVDQGLSQLHHLYLFQTDPRYADGRVYLFSGESLTFLLKAGRHRIRVRDEGGGSYGGVSYGGVSYGGVSYGSGGGGVGSGVGSGPAGSGTGGAGGAGGDVFGKYVGILPVGGPSRITTKGLEWDVRDWETRFGGRVSTSNHVLPTTEVVEVETTEEVLFTIALRQA